MNPFELLSATAQRLVELPWKLLGRHDAVAVRVIVEIHPAERVKAAIAAWSITLHPDRREAVRRGKIYLATLKRHLAQKVKAGRLRAEATPRAIAEPMPPPGTIFEILVGRRVRYFAINQLCIIVIGVTQRPVSPGPANPG